VGSTTRASGTSAILQTNASSGFRACNHHVKRDSAAIGHLPHHYDAVVDLGGGTPWQRELYRHLGEHGQHEHELLDAYQRAAEESESPAFCYLAALIVEDERRHHQTMSELARSLRIDVEQLREEQPVPPLGHWGFDHHRIVELTEKLLEQERKDAAELARLAEEVATVASTTMWPLLIDLMLADTAKHMRILEFVRDRAGRDD